MAVRLVLVLGQVPGQVPEQVPGRVLPTPQPQPQSQTHRHVIDVGEGGHEVDLQVLDVQRLAEFGVKLNLVRAVGGV